MHSVVPTRGVKFKYIIGEKVLCYEPDPCKAKVLYESKVLDLVAGKEGTGRKRPEYLVHFHGWSNSWDRCVKEDWVLPMTDENRDLQRRLAEEATIYLKGRRRIPPLFKEALAKNNKVIEKEEPVSDHGLSDSSEDETEKEVFINIPEALRSQLEEDYRCITKKNKLVAIPCFPNVVAILEDFVKHSAAKMLCESPPKNGKQFMPDDVQDKLCLYKEAADGIRVSFDSTLPHLLLYGQEKKQHYSHCSTARPHRDHHEIAPTSLKVEPPSSDPEFTPLPDWETEPSIVIKQEPASPKSPPKRGRPRLQRNTPEKADSNPVVEETANSSPVIRRNANRNKVKATANNSLVVKATTSKNRGIKSVANKKPAVGATANQKTQVTVKKKKGRPKLPPARILRSSRMPIRNSQLPVAKKPASCKKTPPKRKCTKTPSPQPITIKTEPGPSLCEDRITRRGSVQARIAMENHTALKNNFCIPELNHKPESSSYEDRITRQKSVHARITMENHFAASPFPIETHPSPSSLINSVSTMKVGSSNCIQGVGIRRLEGLLKDTVEWKMLPEHVWEIVPAEPSLLYGAQHLLRLFVKLPDLISKMRIPNRKLQPLLDILHQFLEYMLEQKDRLFLPSAYVDCPNDK